MVTATAASRMTLDAIRKGKIVRPVLVTLYGVEGIGKSTFGSRSPRPIFIGSEDGTDHLDVERFPQLQTWDEMYEALRTLGTTQHEYKTLVVDTLDWCEPMIWRHICQRDGKTDIEEYGYGKGYNAAVDEWRRFLSVLGRLRDVKEMNITLLAHSWIKPFKNPEGEDFDRYQMKLHDKAAGLIKEWSDCVLFANYETFAKKDPKTKRVRGVSTGARMIYTQRTAAYDAKNHFDLPESMPLNWDDFYAAVQAHRPADPVALIEEITRKAKEIGGDTEARALEAMQKYNTDPAMLAHVNDRLNALLAQKEEN